MSTFAEDNDNKTNQQQQPTTHKGIAEGIAAKLAPNMEPNTSNIPFSEYTNSLNQKYQDRIKLAAQSSNYKIDLCYKDGRQENITFTRMKLLQWQFDEIEDLRITAAELSASPGKMIESNKKLRDMYRSAAKYLLFNTKTEKPMTDEEYDSCHFADLRPAIDSAILLSLVSDPN